MRVRAVGTLIVLAMVAAFVAGCGGSSGSGRATVNDLTRAADVSSSAPGFKTEMTIDETIPNAGRIALTARGSFTPSVPTGAMTAQMTLPPSTGLGTLGFQVVIDKTTMYMKLPAQFAGKVPGGKQWLYASLDQWGKASGTPGLGGLISGNSSVYDPGQYLSFLRAMAVGSIKNLGQTTVNGARTTHYAGDVDVAKLPAAVPAAARPAAEQLVAALHQRGGPTRMPIDVWIDASHLVRRLAVTYSATVSGKPLTGSVTEDFLQYGPQPAPAVPDPSQTVNLRSLTHGAP